MWNMKKKILSKERNTTAFLSRLSFLLLLAFLSLSSLPVSAQIPLPPLIWHASTANGSRILSLRPDGADFEIRRIARGPKRDPDTHGYAYLLSSAIPLSPGWRRIVLEGRWWQEPTARTNYEEMTMEIFGHYPTLIHGKSRDGIRLSNYAEVSYDTWNRQIRFEDRGDRGHKEIRRIPRTIPTAPSSFLWQIDRNPQTGAVDWSFYEYRRARWERIYRQIDSKLFEGTRARKLYWKIGGWSTFEHPVATRLHFDLLSYRILYSLPPEKPYRVKKQPSTLPNNRIAKDKTLSRLQNLECINEVPLPPFLAPADEMSRTLRRLVKGLREALGSDEALISAYDATVSITEVADYYRRYIPRPWKKEVDLVSPSDGGILVWSKGAQSLQIALKPENGRLNVIIGCGRKYPLQ